VVYYHHRGKRLNLGNFRGYEAGVPLELGQTEQARSPVSGVTETFPPSPGATLVGGLLLCRIGVTSTPRLLTALSIYPSSLGNSVFGNLAFTRVFARI